MIRVFFGLVFILLTACGGAFAGEPPAPVTNHGASPTKPSSVDSTRWSGGGKRAARVPQPLPLSSASAYAPEHPTTLPTSPALQPIPHASKTWTGFYMGAGAGAVQP